MQVHVELQFTKHNTTPITYIKDLAVTNSDHLSIEGEILALPFIRTAESKGWTLSTYDWKPL